MPDLSYQDFCLYALIAFGSLVQGSLGFGMAVIASPFFMLIDPRLVPVTLLVNAGAISILNAWRFRQGIVLRELWFAFLGRIPGTLVAATVLKFISNATLSLIVAISVLLAVFVSGRKFNIAINRKSSLIAGFFSGFMGTSSGVGGPPMAILYQSSSPEKLRGNLSLYFSLACIFSLTVLGLTDQMDQEILLRGLSLLPAAFLGTWLSKYPLRMLNPRTFRLCILSLCALAAVGVLTRTIAKAFF